MEKEMGNVMTNLMKKIILIGPKSILVEIHDVP